MTERRRLLPVALLVLGLALGLESAWLFQKASAETPRPAFDGTVAVVTNGADDAVDLDVAMAQNEDGLDSSTLLIDGTIRPRSQSNVWVAVGFAGDALPPGDAGVADVAVSTDLDEGQETGPMAVYGLQEGTAFFVPRSTWPGEPFPYEGVAVDQGAVVVGQLEDCSNDRCGFAVRMPLREEMVVDAGASWTLSSPVFGVTGVDSVFPTLRNVSVSSLADGTEAEAFLDAQDWSRPSELEAELELPDEEMADSVQQSGTTPAQAFGSVWSGGNLMKVDAVFSRPQLVESRSRQQFMAVVLVLLGAPLVVWALQIWVGGPRMASFAGAADSRDSAGRDPVTDPPGPAGELAGTRSKRPAVKKNPPRKQAATVREPAPAAAKKASPRKKSEPTKGPGVASPPADL